MDASSYLSFIAAAYMVAVLIIAALIGWVMLDHRSLKRLLADCEGRGMTRRSSGATKPAS